MSSVRFMHARLRTHAESVAFFGGGSREKAVSFLHIDEITLILSCEFINGLFPTVELIFVLLMELIQ